MIADAIDTGDNYIGSVIDTSEQLSLGPLIRMCKMSVGAPFYGGPMTAIGDHVRLRQPKISPFWFELVLTHQNLPGQEKSILSIHCKKG